MYILNLSTSAQSSFHPQLLFVVRERPRNAWYFLNGPTISPLPLWCVRNSQWMVRTLRAFFKTYTYCSSVKVSLNNAFFNQLFACYFWIVVYPLVDHSSWVFHSSQAFLCDFVLFLCFQLLLKMCTLSFVSPSIKVYIILIKRITNWKLEPITILCFNEKSGTPLVFFEIVLSEQFQ